MDFQTFDGSGVEKPHKYPHCVGGRRWYNDPLNGLDIGSREPLLKGKTLYSPPPH